MHMPFFMPEAVDGLGAQTPDAPQPAPTASALQAAARVWKSGSALLTMTPDGEQEPLPGIRAAGSLIAADPGGFGQAPPSVPHVRLYFRHVL